MKLLFAVLFSLIITATIIKSQEPTISTVPSDGTVHERENFTILCDSRNVAVSVSLRIDGVDSSANQRVIDTDPHESVTKLFIFTSVVREDDGLLFTCFSISVGTTSQGVTLSVVYVPEYTFTNTTYEIRENDPFIVTAYVSANPGVSQPDTVWKKESETIFGDGGLVLNGTVLSIETVNRAHAGAYTITGNNTVGTGSASFELIVYFGPDFINDDGPMVLDTGDRLVIDCSVSESGSNPEVDSITLSGTSLTERNVLSNQNYIVTAAVNRDYNGRNYTCEASNGETEQQITYIISVNIQGYTDAVVGGIVAGITTFFLIVVAAVGIIVYVCMKYNHVTITNKTATTNKTTTTNKTATTNKTTTTNQNNNVSPTSGVQKA